MKSKEFKCKVESLQKEGEKFKIEYRGRNSILGVIMFIRMVRRASA